MSDGEIFERTTENKVIREALALFEKIKASYSQILKLEFHDMPVLSASSLHREYFRVPLGSLFSMGKW